MKVSEVRRLSDDALRHGLRELVAHDRNTTVRLLIHVGEFDARRLYREDGYSCMRDYCIEELAMSEDVAYKRIWVARKARRFPGILVALNEGSLTLTAVAMLSKHLSDENAQNLLHAAGRKTNAQVAELIAQHFPRPDLPTLVQPLVFLSQSTASETERPIEVSDTNCQALAARHVNVPGIAVSRPRVTPNAPQRYAVQFTISQTDRELLRRAQDLLQESLDEAEVFVRALRHFVARLEKRKFGAIDRPQQVARESANPRHIPARVRRMVRERDGDQCTFVAKNGHRCESRNALEFDHILPIARGGKSAAGNLRLRCRAHNQYEADQTFGAGFMEAKKEQAQEAAARKRIEEVTPWLQALGIRADHARQAAERCDSPRASLEDRVKAALACFGPRDVQLGRAAPA